MIVEPDFFEHWKTRALVSATGKPESPLWLQRLWAHCQTRKAWKFTDLPLIALAGVCGIPGDLSAEKWAKILKDCRLIELHGDIKDPLTFEVHDWKEHNSGLRACWTNGRRGGRPKGSRTPTGGKPDGLPKRNPLKSDGSEGLDGSDRKDGSEGTDPAITIFSAYPRHVGRKEALQAIRSALRKRKPDFLLEKTRAYAAAVAAWPAGQREFVPNPARWFGRESYDDDPATWHRAAAQKTAEETAAAGSASVTGTIDQLHAMGMGPAN